jgi:hypothetical protein
MRIIHQDWVCLASEHELQVARAHALTTPFKPPVIAEPLWRHIQVLATPHALLLEMGSVSELNKTSVLPKSCAKYGFAWDDLEDAEFLCKMVAHEQFCVGTRVLQALHAIRRTQAAIKSRLAAFPTTPKI